ncbi:MAG: DUF885 domain-containing protein [Lachnospiraceae bacterium]|nr:DUF885 domain-containing protein [Lachnospiraceae bacterium]
MKCNLSPTKKKLLVSLLCLAGTLLLLAGYLSTHNDSRRFRQATYQLFREEMLANTLNMHYTIAHPEDFNIMDYEAILPGYTGGNHQESRQALENQIAFFKDLNPNRLSAEENYTRALLLTYLENTQTLNQFPYYTEPLSPGSGMQSQLPILLAEYTFRSKQDVEDYLKLLDQTDEYFGGLLTFEQEKAAEGLFMSSTSVDKVIEQCDTIVTKEDLKANTHFLQTTFQERLDGLQKEGLVTTAEAETYMQQNNRLLSTVLLPAYQALGDGLTILKDEKIPLQGLAAHPQGKEYYKALLISETGSYRSIEEIKALLQKQLDVEYGTLISLLSQCAEPTLVSAEATVTECFPCENAGEMLQKLTEYMGTLFPSMTTVEDTNPQVKVKNISPSLEEYCAPAFYLTPPLDDTDSNVIYINQKNSPESLELFTTLAHEGYPGHMYQSVYSNNLLAGQDTGLVRQLLWYGGYLEGWALYVEFLSYDCASGMMEEQGYSPQAEYIQIEKHNRSLQLCLYSLLDIMIHHDNASYSQVHDTLCSFGISSPQSTAAIYEYIVEEPANYLKYYLGYLEILTLQEEARSLWGNNYTDYAFHEFFLQNGPADYRTLGEVLKSAPVSDGR